MAAKRQSDLRKLAIRQRWMVWLVLAVLCANIAPLFLNMIPLLDQFEFAIVYVCALVQITLFLLGAVGVILLLTAQGNHPIIIIVTGLLMIMPCANLLVLLMVNMSVTRTLKRAGLRVGMLGVDPDELERRLNPDLCNGCGYDLTGNVSGLCPECGRPVDSGGVGWLL